MARDYMDEIRKYQENMQGGVPAQASIPGLVGAQSTTLSGFLTQVYTWMTLGLALTGFVAYATFASGFIMTLLSSGQAAWFGLLIFELVLVIAFSALVRRNVAAPILAAMFVVYSAINGITLSVLLLVYTSSSVVSTFFITSAVFGTMALYGLVTKKDLSGMGQFMMIGLFGIIIASIVNLFIGSSAMSWGISLIAVVIFVGLTAWDSQKLKLFYASASGDESQLKRFALSGALMLYLDFINLFIHLLSLMGRKK